MKTYLLWRATVGDTCKRELVGVYSNLATAEGEEINREIYSRQEELFYIEGFEDVEVKIEA